MPRHRGNQYGGSANCVIIRRYFSFWMRRKGLLKQQNSCINRKNENSHFEPTKMASLLLISHPLGKPRQSTLPFLQSSCFVLIWASSASCRRNSRFKLEDGVWDPALPLSFLGSASEPSSLPVRCALASCEVGNLPSWVLRSSSEIIDRNKLWKLQQT